MASTDGRHIELHRLEGAIFILKDGTEISPTYVVLEESEIHEMVRSGQAMKLLEKYEPVEHEAKDKKSYSFKLRTNHDRHLYRRMLREKAREEELKRLKKKAEAKNES